MQVAVATIGTYSSLMKKHLKIGHGRDLFRRECMYAEGEMFDNYLHNWPRGKNHASLCDVGERSWAFIDFVDERLEIGSGKRVVVEINSKKRSRG